MNPLPLQFLLMTLAGWVNRNQQDVIEYLQEENRVLREHLGGRRFPFTNGMDQAIDREGLWFALGRIVRNGRFVPLLRGCREVALGRPS
jgi:hypothetical protein